MVTVSEFELAISAPPLIYDVLQYIRMNGESHYAMF